MYLFITILICAIIAFSMYREGVIQGYKEKQTVESLKFWTLFEIFRYFMILNPMKVHYVHGLGSSSFILEYDYISGPHANPNGYSGIGPDKKNGWMTVISEHGHKSCISMMDANVIKNGYNRHSLFLCKDAAEAELAKELKFDHYSSKEMFDDI